MKTTDVKTFIESFQFEKWVDQIYGPNQVTIQKDRYLKLFKRFIERFPTSQETFIFSAPGRIEVSGNHTDHQLGEVIAAAIHLDTIAFVDLNQENIVHLEAEGYAISAVDLSDLNVKEEEFYTSMALIRGIAKGFYDKTQKISGFNAVVSSNVFSGSGLSSSASFEVLIAAIFNDLVGSTVLSRTELAQIAQYSENVYFNKPCGLMDQMAIAQGSFVHIDFYDQKNPKVEALSFENLLKNQSLYLLQTGGSHADLSDAYAEITQDLKSVSKAFGVEYLSRIQADVFYHRLNDLNTQLSTQSILRAHHYFSEIERVHTIKKSILENDSAHFRSGLIESGHSSYMYLKNILHPKSDQQPLALALACVEKVLKDTGAYRVHGGGFGGTLLMVVPNSKLQDLKNILDPIYGTDALFEVRIRPIGVTQIN
jgi:galactokinase